MLMLVYWLPFLAITLTSPLQKKVAQLPVSEAVIIFGTLVREDKVSALLKERLDAGIGIIKAGKAKQIVVSNTPEAAAIMRAYLIENGIQADIIEVDGLADKTPDTCQYEKHSYPNNRKLIFVSQGYHLPRIRYQCSQLGVEASLFPAESIRLIRVSLLSSTTVFTTRVGRYFREAGLTWLSFVGIY